MTSQYLSKKTQPASEQLVSMSAYDHRATILGQPSLCNSGIDETDPLTKAPFLEEIMHEERAQLEACLQRYGDMKIEIQGLGRQSYRYNQGQCSSLAIIVRKGVMVTNDASESEQQWHLVRHALENPPDTYGEGATRTEVYKSQYRALLGRVLALCLSDPEDDSQPELMLAVPGS